MTLSVTVTDRIADYRDPVAASYDYEEYTQVLLVRTPYNPSFIAKFKEIIPYSCRRWDSDRKLWIVTDMDFVNDVINLLAEYFPNFSIGDI